MKKYVIGCVIVTFLIFPPFVKASGSNIKEVVQLPKGLEAYYPPKTDRPFYLFKMLNLEGAFSGIAAELEENDLEGARYLFKVFKTEYSSVKNMVDEWKKIP